MEVVTFLGKLGPHPPSSRIFGRLSTELDHPRASQLSQTWFLVVESMVRMKRKLIFFAQFWVKLLLMSVLYNYNYVEEFVSNFDYSDENFSNISFVEMVEVIKSLMMDSTPG